MSEEKRERKRTARERIRQQRQQDEDRARRRRTVAAVGVAVGVAGVIGAVGALVVNQGGGNTDSGGPVAVPKGAVGKHKTIIPVGSRDAKATISVFEDFRCPACGQFEKAFGKTIRNLTDDGKARAEYSIVSFIDSHVGGSGSKKAANAAACAQDAGAFEDYHRVLYANQPPETDDAFGNKAHLIDLADEVPKLKGDRGFRRCVDDDHFRKWVARVQKEFTKSSFTSTPTVLLNGKKIHPAGEELTPRRLEELVAKVNDSSDAG